MSFVQEKLLESLLNGPYPRAVLGTDLSSEAYLLSELFKANPSKRFVRITKDLKEGLEFKQNLEFFLDGVIPAEAGIQDKLLWFPPHDNLPYTGILSGTDTAADRLACLKALLEKEGSILVAPWQAVVSPIIPLPVFEKYQRR